MDVCSLLACMSFGTFSLWELAWMHCVYLVLWTHEVLCGFKKKKKCQIWIFNHSFKPKYDYWIAYESKCHCDNILCKQQSVPESTVWAPAHHLCLWLGAVMNASKCSTKNSWELAFHSFKDIVMKKVTDVMLKFAVHTMILCVKSDSWSDFMVGVH